MIRLLLLFSLSLSSVFAASVTGETGALEYLKKYGYMKTDPTADQGKSSQSKSSLVSNALREYQAFNNLRVTGELDRETMELMERPRCGMVDISDNLVEGENYLLQGSKWPESRLTWRVTKYPADSLLTRRDIDATVTQAFQMWADVSGLQFTGRQQGRVDIEIRFESYGHGDGDPFDGPRGVLAHAYFPQFGGDIHMDSSESWTIRTVRGTNLLQTMTHEIGHSLGLRHSEVRDSIMTPYYQRYDPANPPHLARDDVKAVQALYGDRRPNLQPPTRKPPASDGGSYNQLCREDKIDAIFRTEDDNTYVFQGDQYWRLADEGVARGYPRPLSDWGLPAGVDAAFTWHKTGATYVFRGDKFWKYHNTVPAQGYPKSMYEGFPGIPNHVDAAFVWGGNDKIYFTKGDQYWRFDPDNRPHVPSQYPKHISDWSLPSGLDGAMQWHTGQTYFFRGGQYWRFDDTQFTIAKSSPSYPRQTSQWWFGC